MIISHRKIDLVVDVEPLKAELESNSDLFGQYNYRAENNSPHSEMKDIWVRYNKIEPYLESGDFSTFADEHESVWYPCVEKIPHVLDIISKLMEKVKGKVLGGVLITKLLPGGEIKPHTDSGWHAANYEKYYVAIKNKEGSTFYFKDGEINPKEGEIFWFDNSHLHWVKNKTDMDRIAMIICIDRGK